MHPNFLTRKIDYSQVDKVCQGKMLKDGKKTQKPPEGGLNGAVNSW